jgi:virginiamycin B lyase
MIAYWRRRQPETIMRPFLLVLLFIPFLCEAQVSVQEYPIPKNLRAHDVWADAAPGGPVYFSAQGSGHLGILDPKSGKVETVALGGGSSPHGVVIGPDGGVWLTDGGQNAIVRVDPAKGREVKVWKLPADTGYTNLNTATFDGKGIHWFTGQSGIYGRLEPKSGKMEIFDAPKGRGPYGIHATPDGTVYYASLAGSFVGRIDANGSTKVLEPPTRRQGARRVWSDSKGNIWVSEWNSGNLSRFEPLTNKWSAWRAPGEDPHVYAVYVDADDKVWASEWSAQVMLRFDPQTEKFETFRS